MKAAFIKLPTGPGRTMVVRVLQRCPKCTQAVAVFQSCESAGVCPDCRRLDEQERQESVREVVRQYAPWVTA